MRRRRSTRHWSDYGQAPYVSVVWPWGSSWGLGTAGDGPGDRVEGVGDAAVRYDHRLVACQGDLTVAIDPVPGVWLRSPVPKPWSFGWHSPTADEALARLALEHGAPPAD